jgi:hypothetical protein
VLPKQYGERKNACFCLTSCFERKGKLKDLNVEQILEE